MLLSGLAYTCLLFTALFFFLLGKRWVKVIDIEILFKRLSGQNCMAITKFIKSFKNVTHLKYLGILI